MCTSPYPAWKVFDGDKVTWKVGSNRNVDNSYSDEFMLVPCGQCIECRLAHAREWSNRCMMESQYHSQSLFLTLTYDDEHLPQESTVIFNDETGEFLADVHSLVKKDLTDFIKRLRYYYDKPIRYIACGEYGSKTYRPHFHLIVFGLDLNDLKILKRNYKGDIYYTSAFLGKVWTFGHHIIGSVTPESCGYVARYTTKKLLGKDGKLYEKYNIVPPYLVMSRNPGIGYQWLQDHKESIYTYDNITLSTIDGSLSAGVPRYFRKRMEQEDGERFVDYSVKREQRLLDTNKLEYYNFWTDNDKVIAKFMEFDNIEANLNSRLGHLNERSAV